MAVHEVSTNASGYPLDWPVGWKRTEHRAPSRYQVTFARARDEVLNTLRLMGVPRLDVVISTNIPIKRDGFPYADSREPSDPGVAVYWVRRGKTQVIACDRWATVRANLRAVGYALEGLRTMERCGANHIVERAYLGFNALPADVPKHSHWRYVLGFPNGTPTEAEIKAAYRELVKRAHPDHGGTADRIVEVNDAYADAMNELKAVSHG